MNKDDINAQIQSQVGRIDRTRAQLSDAAAEAQSEIKIRLLEQMIELDNLESKLLDPNDPNKGEAKFAHQISKLVHTIELDELRIAASNGEAKLARKISKLEHMIELDGYKVEALKEEDRRELVATITSLRIQHEIELAKLKGNNQRAAELERSMSFHAAPGKDCTEVLFESFKNPPFSKDELLSKSSIRTFLAAHKLPQIPINATYYDAIRPKSKSIESYIVVDNLSHHVFDFFQHQISEMFINKIRFKDTEDGNIAIYDFLVDRPMLWLANTIKKGQFSSDRNKAEALSSTHSFRPDYLLQDESLRVCMIGEEKKKGDDESGQLAEAINDLKTKDYEFLKSKTTKEGLPFVFAYAAAGRLFQLFLYCLDGEGKRTLVELTEQIMLDNMESRFFLITKIIGIARVIVEMCDRFLDSQTRQLVELIPTDLEIRRKHMTDLCKLLGTKIRNTPKARLTEDGAIEVLDVEGFNPIDKLDEGDDFNAAITSMLEALTDMHQAGFVHGHIDWNDVVREVETGRYLLVNFDKACRVDEYHKPSDDLVSISKMVLKEAVAKGEKEAEAEGEEEGDEMAEASSPMLQKPNAKRRKKHEESPPSAADTQEEQEEKEKGVVSKVQASEQDTE